MRNLLSIALASFLMLATAGAATAVDPVDDGQELAELHTVRTYFHCADEIKVSNVSAAATNTEVTWDETAPTTSYTEGGGCGTADTQATGTADANPIYDAPFHGSYDGAIDSVTVHIDNIDLGGSRADERVIFRLHFQVDGRDYVVRDDERVFEFTGTRSETGLTTRLEFTITDIGLIHLDDDVEHDIDFTLYTHFVDYQNAWVFDATEIDGGLTFNPEEPAANTIKATQPQAFPWQ